MRGRRRKTPLANAQKIDPDDTAATMGIVKAQVFKPPAGEKYSVPEVVDAKLNYLLSQYPNDDQLLLLKGVRVQDEDADEAFTGLTLHTDIGTAGHQLVWKSHRHQPHNLNSVGSYVNLGFIYDDQDHFDLDLVIKNLELALEQDGDYPMTHENLGFAFLPSTSPTRYRRLG